MSITLLRTLIAVAETGSFVAATARINISQAAIGQQMKRLEEMLDLTLFDRSKKTPTLNSTGQALTARARDVVAAYDSMLNDLRGDSQLFGEMTLGAVPSTLSGLVPEAIKRLIATYPGLRIRVVPGLSDSLTEQIERGALDAALLGPFRGSAPRLLWQPIASEPFVLIAAQSVQASDVHSILASQPFIQHTRRAAAGRLAQDWLTTQRLSVSPAMEMETLEAVASMVSHGLGVSIVPQSCVASPTFQTLKTIPLPQAPVRELGLLSLADSGKRRMIEHLLKELLQVVA